MMMKSQIHPRQRDLLRKKLKGTCILYATVDIKHYKANCWRKCACERTQVISKVAFANNQK